MAENGRTNFPFIDDIFRDKVDPRLDELTNLAERVLNQIDRIAENTASQIAAETYAYMQQVANTGAAGTDVEVVLNPPPAGTAWVITNVAVTGGALGPCAVYIDARSPTNLIHFITDAEIHSDVGIDLYIPQNRSVIFHFYTQPNNQVVTVNAQVKQLTRQAQMEADIR